ncbi:hypothetical protein XENOCAPTIV_020908 [Xenoophorus captivus]|uniref:ABC transmembrane type-1 domain-containing protein n=1 Tax=Xenoophorus captivus TaxID=1517983 RepID=A0ABV0RRR3_9TELE
MGVITWALCIILLDALLSSAQWAGLLLLKCSSCGGLAGVWAFGLVKWVFLHVLISALADRKHRALPHRFAALLCFIAPVFETGRVLTESPSEQYRGPSLDPIMLLLGAASSSLACLIWEKWLSRDGQMKKENLDTKRLLKRVLTYFKPDTVHLITAFGFLIMGVILFSGMRGGIFMVALARLNKRLKHLLFHNLLKQEVHFFEANNPG